MAQEAIKEMKRSVKGKMLILVILLMIMLIVNVALGIVLQTKQAETNVKNMLTDNLNGSYALVQKGLSYFGSDPEALTPENLNVIIANNSCDTMILDSKGSVIASYMKNGTAQSSYKEYVQNAGQSTLYPKATGKQGDRRVYAAKGIDGTDHLTLLICAPSSEYYSGLITAVWINAALVVVMGILAVCANIFFSKSVTTPLGKIRAKIIEMSQGNLSGTRVDINTDDELGVLASAVNSLSDYTNNIIHDIDYTAEEIAKENLCVKPKAQYNGDFLPVKNALEDIVSAMKDVVSNIETAGREVSASSAQMSQNSALLSQAADEGAATVKELSDSLNSVHEQINNSAEKAALARNMTETSVTAINEGNEKMNKMLDAMREINATSSQIANIIKTIQDISFQTNILSLNASIEAARAGAAGKGFAVVAGEVGSLAGKTAEAAKSTTKLIETSLKAVEHGMIIANESAEMLGMIVGKANESAEVVEEIAQISIKQAESIKQSIADMDRISASMTQVNSAARDCADSSTMLAAQSVVLEDTVNKFIIDANDVRTAKNTTRPTAAPVTAAPKPVASAPKPAAPTPKPAAPAPKPAAPAPKPVAPAPVASASKPAAKSPIKIELPDDNKPSAPLAKTATAKPDAPKPVLTKPAAKPASKIVLPDDEPAAKPVSTPMAKPVSTPAAKPVSTPTAKPAPAPAAKPAAAASKAKPMIKLPDDDKAVAPVSAGKVVKKATMQPVNRTVRMDPDKY